jgi:hypothetical protein
MASGESLGANLSETFPHKDESSRLEPNETAGHGIRRYGADRPLTDC